MTPTWRPAPIAFGTAVALALWTAGCAQILGIEIYEERYPTAGAGGMGGLGGTGGESGGGLAGGGGDGGTGAAGPTHLWSQRFGDGAAELAYAAAVDGQGNVGLTGYFAGDIQFGNDSHTSVEGSDAFVAKLNDDGSLAWSQAFGGTDNQYGRSVAFDSSGNLVVAGHFLGTIHIDDSDEIAAGTDLFVTKLDPDGAVAWSRVFGATSSQQAFDVAIDRTGGNAIVVVGRFQGELPFEGTTLSSVGNIDLFVAKLDSAGAVQWAVQHGDNALEQAAAAVAVGPDSSVVLAGVLNGSASFGTDILTSSGGKDVLVAKLDATGVPRWARSYGDGQNQEAHAVAVDSNGTVFVAGYFEGTLECTGPPVVSTGQPDAFVLGLAADGTCLWARQMGNEGATQVGRSLAVGPGGTVFAAGRFGGSVDFGRGPVSCGGDEDLFLIQLADDGTTLHDDCFGTSGNHDPYGLAASGGGEVIMAGSLGGSVDFGGGLLTTAGDSDVFVTKLRP